MTRRDLEAPMDKEQWNKNLNAAARNIHNTLTSLAADHVPAPRVLHGMGCTACLLVAPQVQLV